MVHFYFTQSLRAHQLQKNECLFSVVPVRPLDGFEGPLDFHGHGALGLCVRATLALGITQQTMPWLGFNLFYMERILWRI